MIGSVREHGALFVAALLSAATLATSVAAQSPAERRMVLIEQSLRDEVTGSNALVAHDFTTAEAAYRRAWRAQQKLEPPGSAEVARTAAGLAMALDELDRDEEAAALLDQAIAARAAAGRGETLADLYAAQGRLFDDTDNDRARFAYEAAIEIDRALPGRLAPMVFNLSALADILNVMSRPEEALARSGWAVAIAERLGEPIPHVTALIALAESKRLLGRPEAAIRDLQTARRLIPAPDESLLTALARAQSATGDYEGAAQTAQSAIAAWEALGEDAPEEHARAIGVLANIRTSQRRLPEAEALYRVAIALTEASDDAPGAMVSRVNLAENLGLQGRYGEAEPLLRRALSEVAGVEGPESRNIGFIGALLASNLQAQNRDAEALPLYVEAVRTIERNLGTGHPSLASTVGDMARSTAVVQGEAAAGPLYRRAMTLASALPRGHPDSAVLVQDYARHRLALGESRQALALVRQGTTAAMARGGVEGGAVPDATFERSRGLFRLQVEAAWAAAGA